MKPIPEFSELITKSDEQLYAMLEAEYAALAIAPGHSIDRRRALTAIGLIRKALRYRLALRNRPTLTP